VVLVLNKFLVKSSAPPILFLTVYALFSLMRQVTVAVSLKDRSYIDHLINQGKFASYRHSYRGLLYWHKIYSRQNEAFRAKISALEERLRLYESGALQAKA